MNYSINVNCDVTIPSALLRAGRTSEYVILTLWIMFYFSHEDKITNGFILEKNELVQHLNAST